jgi:hypothetical protein
MLGSGRPAFERDIPFSEAAGALRRRISFVVFAGYYRTTRSLAPAIALEKRACMIRPREGESHGFLEPAQAA